MPARPSQSTDTISGAIAAYISRPDPRTADTVLLLSDKLIRAALHQHYSGGQRGKSRPRPMDIEDLEQEARLELYQSLSSYHPASGAWSTWIYRIVGNHLRTLDTAARAKSRIPLTGAISLDANPGWELEDPTAELAIERLMEITPELLWDAMHRSSRSEIDDDIVTGWKRDDLNCAAIGRKHGISTAAVASRQKKLLARARQILKDYE